MGILGGLKDKASDVAESAKYSNGSVEEAIDHMGKEIAADVEKGNFEEAKDILDSKMRELMSGDMKA